MPSFDIVSEVDAQELDNAVNMTLKEIETRFDFRGGKSKLDFAKVERKITILADDDMKLRAIHQILQQKMAKRGLDLRSLDFGKEDSASGGGIRQIVTVKHGLSKEHAKKITKCIKDAKLKVQAEIQDDQVRVSGKKIDDLQTVIALLKDKEAGLALQFVNMKS